MQQQPETNQQQDRADAVGEQVAERAVIERGVVADDGVEFGEEGAQRVLLPEVEGGAVIVSRPLMR